MNPTLEKARFKFVNEYSITNMSHFLKELDSLPPITEADRELKMLLSLQGLNNVDLGEDIEKKEAVARAFQWKKKGKPRIRTLVRSQKVILFKDYF